MAYSSRTEFWRGTALGSGSAPDSAAVNALGVFLVPRLREDDLLAARAEIDAALEKTRNTAWPGDPDYRAAGYLQLWGRTARKCTWQITRAMRRRHTVGGRRKGAK